MRKKILLKIVLSFALLILILGCATPSGIKESATDETLAMITDMKVEDNTLVITGNKYFIYTVYSSNDPYRTTIEIPGMSVGSFTDKIISDNSDITEVIPQQINLPKQAVRIDIVLQNPSSVVPAYKDNTLTLTVKAEEPVDNSGMMTATTMPQTVNTEKAEKNIAPMSKATEISNIEIKKVVGGVKVLISGNGTMIPNVFPIDDRIVVDIPDVSLNAAVPSSVISPLKGIRAGKHKEKVRLVLDLLEKTNYDVAAIGSSIEISLQKTDVVSSKTQTYKLNDSATGLTSTEPEKMVEGNFSGKRISLDFQDADIIPIFRLLADISGYNIVVSPGVSGRTTLKLINVPWDQALDIILRTFSLTKLVDGNIIRIVPTATVAKEMDEITRAKKAAAEAGELRTKVFPVNYAELAKLKDAIDKAKVVSSRGSITLDERGSSLIINDLDDNLEQIGALIAELDQESMQARQVVIEAKIVEVNSDYTKDLGVQWGFLWNGLKSDNSYVVSKGGNNDNISGVSGTSVALDSDLFNVNLPAAVGAGSGGSIGISYLNKAASLVLNLQLSAMEQLKKGKVLSTPSVMTMNNQEAKITQGKTIYLGVATADKIDYKAIDALLSLTVKPRIAPGGAIFMDLDITKDEPGTVTSGGVDILKNTVKTTVLVNDSETVVIGGIFKQTESDVDDGVPGLSKIPILGYLFKKNKKVTTNTEVMIFITPKIVEFNSMN